MLPPFEKHFTEYLDEKKSPITSFFFAPISLKEIKFFLCLKTNHMGFNHSVSILKYANEIILSEVLSNISYKSIELGMSLLNLK